MLGPVEGEPFHLHGIFEADLILGTFPPAVVALQTGPVFEPRQLHVVESCVVHELLAVMFPQLMSMLGFGQTQPNLRTSRWPRQTAARPRCRPGQCSSTCAKRADLRVELGPDELAKIVHHFKTLVHFDGADLNDFHFSRFRLRQQVASKSYTMNCLSLIGPRYGGLVLDSHVVFCMTKQKPKLVVLTGAGMSAESGIATFEVRTVCGKATGWKRWPRPKASQPIRVWCWNSTTSDVGKLSRPSPTKDTSCWPGWRRCLTCTSSLKMWTTSTNGPEASVCSTFMEKLEKPAPQRILNAWWSWRDRVVLGDSGQTAINSGRIVWFGEEVPAFGQATKIMDAADLVLVWDFLAGLPGRGFGGVGTCRGAHRGGGPHSPLEGGGHVEVLPVGAVEGLALLETRWSSADPQAPGADV